MTGNRALDIPRIGLSAAEMDRACAGVPGTCDVTVADVTVRALPGGMGLANFDGIYTSRSARCAGEWAVRVLTANSALDRLCPELSMAEMDRACPGAPDTCDVAVDDVIVCAILDVL